MSDDDSMSGSDMDKEPEWLLGARAQLDAMYAADPRLYMGTKMAPEWQFLYDHFNAIQGCLGIADPDRLDTHAVRIGRDIDDRWIQVAFDSPLASDYTPFPDSDDDEQPRSQSSRYQVIRESLVLTSVLARADYTTWIEELGRACQFDAPKAIDLDLAPLQRKFLFEFDSQGGSSELAWTKLRHLFGDQGYDHEFQSEFARAVEVAASQGVNVGIMDPIPIHLKYVSNALWSETEQIQALGGIADTIRHIQQIETSYRCTQRALSAGLPPVPVFTVDSITLEMDNHSFTPAVLQELQRLLEVDVHIKSLTLPMFPFPRDPDWLLCLSAWGSLAASICGLRRDHHPTVRSVSISAMSANSPFLVSFLSALRDSRGLESLMLAAGRDFEDENYLWSWIAFSIFRAGTTCSVEVLHLDNIELTSTMNQFTAVLTADDPLGLMWEMLTGNSSALSSRVKTNVPIVVRQGAELCVKHERDQPGTMVRVLHECLGQLIIDDPMDPMAGVFLPGFGLCTIAREFVANRVDPPVDPSLAPTSAGVARWRRRLRTFGLDAHASYHISDTSTDQDDPDDEERLLRFFGLIGDRLTDLDLSTDALNATSLAALLRLCPRLESVRLSSMTLESMDFLVDHYETGGCRISSLELRYMAIDPFVLESFLRRLVAPVGSAVQRTLERLRLDEMWVTRLPDSLVRVLAHVIERDTSLEHLHVYTNSFDELRTLTTPRLAQCHGQPLAPSPVPLVARLALVSALRLQRDHSAVMQLNTDILRLVLAFAGRARRRVVLIDCHTD